MLKRYCFALWMLSLIYRGCPVSADPPKHATPRRPVTVSDSIQMTQATDWSPAIFSPDGKRFLVVLKKGSLKQNAVVYSLLLWQTEDVFRLRASQVLLTMSSSSNRDAIEQVAWLGDNETITFLGEHPGELHQLYAFNVHTHNLRQLTKHSTNVHSYSIDANGTHMAFVAELPSRRIWNSITARYGIPVSTQLLPNLIGGGSGGEEDARGQLFIGTPGNPGHLLSTHGALRYDLGSKPNLSPDGKYIVMATQVVGVPEDWKNYTNPDIQREALAKRRQGLTGFIQQFELIDTVTGETKFLLNAPAGTYGSEVGWLPDSKSLVITRTFLPLDSASGDERKARESHTFTVEVNVSTGNIVKVSNEELYGAQWDRKQGVLISHRMRLDSNTVFGLGEPVLFRKRASAWKEVQGDVSKESRPDILLEQDMSTPPKIVAVRADTHQKSLLLDLNPQFESLKFAKVQEIQWKGADKHDVKGGLYYPLDYVPGKKYPLVIQTHGWSKAQFMIDGPYTTGYAAQALAGNDILVLQADDSNLANHDTPEEAERELATYEGAIRYLDEKGLIDRSRVGLVGFSRSCFFVKFALTHAPRMFAAASLSDGIDAGYFQYIALSNALPPVPEEAEQLNGGQPWGRGLEAWVQRSPGFNTDQVDTPLRIVALNTTSLLGEWEWFASLYQQNKPVELIYLKDGVHELVKPWDRFIAQQGNVDWFAFWLKGEEDPNPAKADQYKRWRELRKQQEQESNKTAAN